MHGHVAQGEQEWGQSHTGPHSLLRPIGPPFPASPSAVRGLPSKGVASSPGVRSEAGAPAAGDFTETEHEGPEDRHGRADPRAAGKDLSLLAPAVHRAPPSTPARGSRTQLPPVPPGGALNRGHRPGPRSHVGLCRDSPPPSSCPPHTICCSFLSQGLCTCYICAPITGPGVQTPASPLLM